MAPAVSLDISGSDVQQENLPIMDGTTILGRAPTSTILLDHPMVSRRHAEIRSDGSGAQIADMGSANGTRINQVELPVKEWQTIRPGDLIEIGPFSLRVKEAQSSAGPATEILRSGTVLISAAIGPVLRVRTPDGNSRDFTLTEPSYTLGRSPENDIVINDPAVSRLHARLEKRGGDSYEIIDLDSTNGLSDNGEKVARKGLRPGDVLGIGQSIQIEFRSTSSTSQPTRAAPIDLRSSPEMVLGRSAGADAVIDHPQVSRVHARILNVDGRLVIEDAGSETGTFVNGNRVDRHVLNEGDAIRLGGQSLRLIDGVLTAPEEDELTLEAVDLRRVVASGVTILRDISVSIKAREFVAIVGPSGAGKSTLMTALCGYQQASSGNVLINGTDFYSHVEAFRNDIGFVPQDDIIHRELNIRRAFNYAARLRMPEDTQDFEREGRIYEVLDELDLSVHADTPVRQLSGGQRKRVSIGVELLTRPSLFFLDEATSGLDPGTETQMMKLFRQLADNGRIVVLVTHATKNVMICDKVAFMAKGGYMAFYGPPEEALTYFGTKDFDEIYLKLEEKSGEEWANMFAAYSHHAGNGSRPGGGAHRTDNPASAQMLETAPSRSPIKQFITLTSRNLETLYRSPKDVAVLLALAPFLGALNFLLWKPDTFDYQTGDSLDSLTMPFMLTIVTLLVGSLGSVREIVKEQAIYKRERMVCVQVLPYVFSKVFIGTVFAFYSAGMLFAFQILAVDFSYLTPAETGQLFIPVFLATLSGVMIGLLVSASSGTEERAMLLIIAVIIPQFLLSGGLLPLKDLGGVGQYLTIPITAKWAYAALITTAKVKDGNCDIGTDLADCHIPGLGAHETLPEKIGQVKSLDRYGGIFDVDLPEYWAAMVILISVVLLAVIVLQKRKDAA
ncbi:MAG TPA: FHA domain-containing protein [Dehalococcoidia bacterium]|nr:FHA domain-containing protein [Dehalococcoidia bacterium]